MTAAFEKWWSADVGRQDYGKEFARIGWEAHAATVTEATRAAYETCARIAETQYRRDLDGIDGGSNPERVRARVQRDIASAIRAQARPAVVESAPVEHGFTCKKVPHTRTGYLHGEDDDRPYDVDGVKYCGRCHFALEAS